MPKFNVTVRYKVTFTRTFAAEVEADSKEAAGEIGLDDYGDWGSDESSEDHGRLEVEVASV